MLINQARGRSVLVDQVLQAICSHVLWRFDSSLRRSSSITKSFWWSCSVFSFLDSKTKTWTHLIKTKHASVHWFVLPGLASYAVEIVIDDIFLHLSVSSPRLCWFTIQKYWTCDRGYLFHLSVSSPRLCWFTVQKSTILVAPGLGYMLDMTLHRIPAFNKIAMKLTT